MSMRAAFRRALSLLPDEPYIRIQYYIFTGRILHLKNPTRFNEKLQWMKLYDRNPRYTDLVDKYRVKRIVGETIGEEYVVPLLDVWDSAEDIDIGALPEKFVLKTNHDSKGVVICTDKGHFDLPAARAFLAGRQKRNGYAYGREWPYKNVDKKIIAEAYIEGDSDGLNDYKVMCFNGEAKLIQLHQARFTDRHTQDIYDIHWKRQPFNQKRERPSGRDVEKPVLLDKMIALSEKLADSIPQVRVDWYIAGDRLYFGEMTFFDGSGYCDFVPDEMNDVIGGWIDLRQACGKAR